MISLPVGGADNEDVVGPMVGGEAGRIDGNRRYPPTHYAETGTQSRVQHECGSQCSCWRLNVHRKNHESARCNSEALSSPEPP